MKPISVNASHVIQVYFFHCTDVVVGCSSAKAVVGGPPMVTNEVVQDLKQNIYKLEEEVSELIQLNTIRFCFFYLLVLGCVTDWVSLTVPETKLQSSTST